MKQSDALMFGYLIGLGVMWLVVIDYESQGDNITCGWNWICPDFIDRLERHWVLIVFIGIIGFFVGFFSSRLNK